MYISVLLHKYYTSWSLLAFKWKYFLDEITFFYYYYYYDDDDDDDDIIVNIILLLLLFLQ